MKYYWLIEMAAIAGLTAALLELGALGGPLGVISTVVVLWVILQLVSSIAFCNAINKRTIVVFPGARRSKETYAVAAGARPGWLVMRHVWTYNLLRRSQAAATAPPRAGTRDS